MDGRAGVTKATWRALVVAMILGLGGLALTASTFSEDYTLGDYIRAGVGALLLIGAGAAIERVFIALDVEQGGDAS